jgi:hypothetical protein
MNKAAPFLVVLALAASSSAALAASPPWCEEGERPLQGSQRLDQVFVPSADVQDQAREALKTKAFEPLDAKLADALAVPDALRTPNAYILRTAGFPSPQGKPTVEVYFDDNGTLDVQTFSLSRMEKIENFAIVVVSPQPVKRIKSLCFAVG